MSNSGHFTAAINTIIERNIDCLKNSISDNTQFVNEWKKRLQTLLNQQSATIIQYITTGSSEGLHDDIQIRKYNDILAKYANPMLSVTASTRDLNLINNIAATKQDIENQIGISPDILHDAMRKATRAYIRTGEDLYAIDKSLQDKLGRLDATATSIQHLMSLEPTEALSALSVPTEAYLRSVFEKNSIESTYRAFIETYSQFAALRSLVTLATEVQHTAGPACTICMTKEVTHAVTPCGHTFCDSCSTKQLTACYICRTQIRDRLRIYY